MGQGFLFGIGFCVAAWGIYFLVYSPFAPAQWKSVRDCGTSEKPAAGFLSTENLVITQQEEIKRNYDVVFLGTIVNRGNKPVSGVTIEVDLFDKNNKFVDQCSGYLAGTLKPNEPRSFKVSCGGSKDEPVINHDHYKIKLAEDFSP
jgi:hypothetical protein